MNDTEPDVEAYARAVARLLAPHVNTGIPLTLITDTAASEGSPVPRGVCGTRISITRVTEAPREMWRGPRGAVVRLDGICLGKRVEAWIATLAPLAVVMGDPVPGIHYPEKGHVLAFPRARNWQSAVAAAMNLSSVSGRIKTLPLDVTHTFAPTDMASLDPAVRRAWFALPIGVKLTDSLGDIGVPYATQQDASQAALAARSKREETHGRPSTPSFVQECERFDRATGVELWSDRVLATACPAPAPPPAEPKKPTKKRAPKTAAST